MGEANSGLMDTAEDEDLKGVEDEHEEASD